MQLPISQHGLSFQPACKGIWSRVSLYLFLLVAGLAVTGFCLTKRLMAYPKLFLFYWSIVTLLTLALLVTGILEAMRTRKEAQRLLQNFRERLRSQDEPRNEERPD